MWNKWATRYISFLFSFFGELYYVVMYWKQPGRAGVTFTRTDRPTDVLVREACLFWRFHKLLHVKLQLLTIEFAFLFVCRISVNFNRITLLV